MSQARQQANNPSHAHRRAQERLGLKLDPGDLLRMAKSIKSGDAKLLRERYTDADGNTLEHWLVPLRGHWVPVVYTPYSQGIVSVLPQDYQPLGTNLGVLLQRK